MKKLFKLLLISILLIFTFTSCALPVNFKKSSKFYYTNELAKNLKFDSSCSGKVFDTNLYKEVTLDKEDIAVLKGFISNLHSLNFIDKPKELPDKPKFKIFLTFNKDKFVINVYNEQYVTIYPWDGDYAMDYINMTGIYNSNNLYGLCKNKLPEY